MEEELDFNMSSGEEFENLNVVDDDTLLENPDTTAKTTESEQTETTEQTESSSESVGSEKNKEESNALKAASQNTENIYSSYAKALQDGGALSFLSDDDINKIDSAEKLVEAFNKAVENGIEDGNKRAYQAISVGVDPTVVNQYESTLKELESINEKSIIEDTDNGEKLRKMLIYNDYLNRGYSKERALKEVDKSFKANTDIEDAKDALQSNKEYWQGKYNELIEQEKQKQQEQIENRQKEIQSLKESMLKQTAFGDLELSETVRKKAFDCIAKPIGKDNNGVPYTEIEKYKNEHPADFLRNIGLLYTLTDGFQKLDGLVQGKVNKKVKESIQNLERTINNTTRNAEGNIEFATGVNDENSTFDFNDVSVADL